MVRPRVVSHAVVHHVIRVAGALGSKLPYRPFGAMFRIEELDKTVERVSVRSLRVGLGRAGSMAARQLQSRLQRESNSGDLEACTYVAMMLSVT